jgi:hypothetical protein
LKKIIPILIILAGSFLIFKGPSFISNFQKNSASKIIKLGFVSQLSGDSEKLVDQVNKVKLHINIPINHLDKIFLHKNSKLKVIFNNLSTVVFSDEAVFVVELWDTEKLSSPIYIHLLQGEYKVINDSKKNPIYILKDITLFSANSKVLKFHINSVKAMESINTTNNSLSQISNDLNNSSSLPDTTQANHQLSLSNEALDKYILKQKKYIQRCQLNRLKELGKIVGQIILGIKIEKDGSVSQVKILSDSIDDRALVQCLKTVFYRIQFPEFQGESIYRSYPLVFK